ncbi:TrgA family protein [Loktanella sp. S4079]|uniref:TrgA family protein n=1 Tax=Loktanella sp. S4079 TaxID=579483 RepID=UPI0005FA2A79|nr:TrgA family protein [Loktanella sp. S4079]KJZ20073.1 tellurite resistance protein [Loktanella sp. S4079]
MPTAGRLAGAVFFALYGWYIAGISIKYFPEQNAPGYLIPVLVALGLFFGWRMCGSNGGRGYNPATGMGLTVAAVLAFWILYIMGFMRMMKDAMRNQFSGPMEAIVASFTETGEVALQFANAEMIGSVLIGGVLCAWATEFFAKRYP